jgi:8-amino-7-oxononanoate synthase
MLDFTSALYLGMRHAHATLAPWTHLTSGRPASLRVSGATLRAAERLAGFLGCERAALAPSTLHLYMDLFDVLADQRIAIYRESTLYPISRWGVERAAAKGVPASAFRAHDACALERLLKRDRMFGRRPIVVADGLCAATGRPAPLQDYLRFARAYGGYLVIDDTQALGILGACASPASPYGVGGVGAAALLGVEGPDVILGTSLAKGFGAPIAVLAGSAKVVAKFERKSATRMHCSPPSLAAVAAAERALDVNAHHGDDLRRRLAQLVTRFREGLKHIGLSATGGIFPIQTLKAHASLDPLQLHDLLARWGVDAVLHRAQEAAAPALSFLITAVHSFGDVDGCIELLNRAKAFAHGRFAGGSRYAAALS